VVGDTMIIVRTQRELWRTKGTRATTQKLVNFGTRRIVTMDDTAYISWYDSKDPTPPTTLLFRSDGTTAGTVPLTFSDGQPITNFDAFSNGFTVSLGDKVIFFSDGLCVSEGTTETTERVKEVYPGDDHWAGYQFAVLNGVLYFDGRTPLPDFNMTAPALWRSDGTAAGTYALTGEFANGLVDFARAVGNSIYFVNRVNKGAELYRYVP
jgi:hypothetical protein